MQVSALMADEDRCVPPNLALAISSRQSIPAPGPPDLRGGRGHRCPEDGSAERAALPHLGKRSEEHTSELQSQMSISYAVFCLQKKKYTHHQLQMTNQNTT